MEAEIETLAVHHTHSWTAQQSNH